MTTAPVIVDGRTFRSWSRPTVALGVLLSVANAGPLPPVALGRADTPHAKSNDNPTSKQTAPDGKPPISTGRDKETEGMKRGDEIRSAKEPTAALDEKAELESTYETQMAVAKAFEAVDESVKAISSYEKAILAAPSDEKKAVAMDALGAIAGVEDNSWLKPTVAQLQSLWVWVAFLAALSILSIPFLLLRRLFRWVHNKWRGEQRFRVVVTSAGRSVESAHFRNLIQQAHDALQTQRTIVERLRTRSVVSIISSFRSNSLVAMLPTSLPTVLAKKWWAPAIPFMSNWLDPPHYVIDMSILPSKSSCGIYVCLAAQPGKTRYWTRECLEGDVPVVLADLAFEVIANINHRQKTGDYAY